MAKPVDREGPIQRAIVQWLEVQFPWWIVHHCKTEINRGGVSFMREAAKAKRMGAKSGFPDLLILPDEILGPIFLEVKSNGNYASKVQKEMHAKLNALGYRVAVVRSVDDVIERLSGWGIWKEET